MSSLLGRISDTRCVGSARLHPRVDRILLELPKTADSMRRNTALPDPRVDGGSAYAEVIHDFVDG
jgi:hypothetical protein